MARRRRGRAPKRFSLKKMVSRQVARVLERGQRFGSFDQIRQRHFWSSFLFPIGANLAAADVTEPGNTLTAGTYDLFKVIPGQFGQGYPVAMTLRETNWLNAGRVPDNQNIAITELGVTVLKPPPVDQLLVDPFTLINAPTNGIANNVQNKEDILWQAPVSSEDAARFLYGTTLNMTFLTNSIPLGLCADFSQSAGIQSDVEFGNIDSAVQSGFAVGGGGNPVNGIPAAAFRRKLEVPILLQHGENMGMSLVVPEDIQMLSALQGGTGVLEIRVDWWATESFVEKS